MAFQAMKWLFFQHVVCALAVYSEPMAEQYARLAGAAYCDPESLKTWSCGAKCQPFNVTNVQVCHGDTTYSYVGRWDDRCLVGFEGSWDPLSWITDASFKEITTPWPGCTNCQAHSGFSAEWFSHKQCVIKALNKIGCNAGHSEIYTTGHSLGAAVNVFAMADLEELGWKVAESYDFGRPRVGDQAFASFIEKKFAGRSWRVVHHIDPVPHLPVTDLLQLVHFKHTNPEVFYTAKNVTEGYNICQHSESDMQCSHGQVGAVITNPLNWKQHMIYMDSVPMYGSMWALEKLVLQMPDSQCSAKVLPQANVIV